MLEVRVKYIQQAGVIIVEAHDDGTASDVTLLPEIFTGVVNLGLPNPAEKLSSVMRPTSSASQFNHTLLWGE